MCHFKKAENMILFFNEQVNGRDSHFVEKIWLGLIQYTVVEKNRAFRLHFDACIRLGLLKSPLDKIDGHKLHTIREDKRDRWKVGSMIHFWVKRPDGDNLQFAPCHRVTSIQKIEILPGDDDDFVVQLDGKELTPMEVLHLAWADGFLNTEDFLEYFGKKPFTGKLIHWIMD